MDTWAVIVEERESLIDTLEGLTPEQWAAPSLCGDWTVQQVLGHLVISGKPPMTKVGREVLKARGSFDRAMSRLAVEEASRPPEALLATYRANLSHRFAPPGFGPAAPLHDILVHSLDIRVPLGLPDDRPAERYRPALDLLFTWKAELALVPKSRPRLRWIATDLDWVHGTGEEVRGRAIDLTLANSGRTARLDGLSGSGQATVATWLSK